MGLYPSQADRLEVATTTVEDGLRDVVFKNLKTPLLACSSLFRRKRCPLRVGRVVQPPPRFVPPHLHRFSWASGVDPDSDHPPLQQVQQRPPSEPAPALALRLLKFLDERGLFR